ncbi:hypothetical protein CEXT_24791 [Caerostris extrusa]|uniref:Uncharacterized protein n=1 Tax=Caerostris extrusa TaxID=172846 RepID=A0AAV4XUL3_CAEEX|nr:hypothetical protein CEXT_24791 [Caerostris extrusa]
MFRVNTHNSKTRAHLKQITAPRKCGQLSPHCRIILSHFEEALLGNIYKLIEIKSADPKWLEHSYCWLQKIYFFENICACYVLSEFRVRVSQVCARYHLVSDLVPKRTVTCSFSSLNGAMSATSAGRGRWWIKGRKVENETKSNSCDARPVLFSVLSKLIDSSPV